MSLPASGPDRASESEWAPDQTEGGPPASAFAEATRWMVILPTLLAAAYVVAYLVTRDLRVAPICLVCASFSASVAAIRKSNANHRFTVYSIGTLIAIGMIGVSASVTGIDGLLTAATLMLPVLFIGLFLTRRDMFRAALVSAAGVFLAEWVGQAATWPRLDLATLPTIRWFAHVLVGAMILLLMAQLFQRFDRAARSARESAHQLELLYETSRLLSATWTLDELLPEVANNLAKIVDATSCFIVLRDPTSGELLQTAADSAHHAKYRQLRIRPDEPSLSAEVIRRREPVGVEDVHSSAYTNPRIAVLFPTQSLLGLPLIHRGEILGAILIGESRRQRRFTPDEIARLQGLVQQVAAEIANAQSVERGRRQAADLAILNRVSTAVAASLDPTEVCRLIVDQLRQTTDYEMASVYLLEDSVLRLQAAIGFDRTLPELSLERGVIGRTALTGEPILLADVTTDPDFIADASNVTSEVCAPIRLGDETLGVINVETRAPRRLDRHDLDLLIAIAAQIAVTLRNAQLFEQTRRHGEGLSFLYKTADAVAATLDYAQIMRVVSDGLMRSLGVQRCVLSRWDRRHNCVVTLGAYALDNAHLFIDTDELGLTYALDTYPATRRLLETQELMQVQADDPDAPTEEVDFIRQMGYASVLALPLVTPTGVFGMIELYSRDKRRFKPDEVSRSLAVANLTATALERERLFDAERHSRQVTETLLDVARAMGSLLDPDRLLGLILDQLRSLIPYVSGSIALLDSGRCEVRASHGLPASLADQPLVFDIAATPTVRRLVTTRRPYRIADTHANPDWLIFESFEHIRAWLGVPLVRNERVIGCLMIDHTEPGFFTEDHERLAEAFAQHAAIAIENTRLLEQTRRRAERERLVRDISGKISASIEIDTVMQTAVDELGRALKPSRCLIRTGADAAYMPVAYEFCQAGIPGLGIGSLEHLPMLKTALSERHTVVDLEPRLLCNVPVQSGLVTPIFIRGRVAGVLALHQCDYPRRWTFEEVALIEEVGGQLGIAIDNARLYEAATHSLSDLNLLHSIAMTVASAASLPEAVQRVVESVLATMRHSHIALLLVEPDSGDLLVRAAVGYPPDTASLRIQAGQGIVGWVARTGQPALTSDTHTDPRFIDGSGSGSIRSELAVPLVAGSEVVGVLNIESTEPDAFDEADLQLLNTLGSNLAMIIRNLRLLDEVRTANARLLDLDRLKSQFLANMSHELRTPLNSIIGFSEILIDGLAGALSDEQNEFVANIHASGKHLLKLINDVLDLSKIQAGKLMLDIHPVDPAGLAEEAGGVIGPLLSRKNQELALVVAPHLPPILADAIRIKQILLNLLSNAHKFSPEGSRIDLRAQRTGDCVCFSVMDQGDGIRAEQHELVFQEFAQLDSSATRRQEGTGLGLPIARQLVEMHGGRLWVDSDGTPGQGTAFHFTIPVVQSAADPGAPASEQPAGDETRRALIIEDDCQFGNLLALYLRQQGYQPIHLDNSQATLKAIRELRPALVTLDLMMPDHDGWSVLRDLRRAPDTRDVPLIIVSALDQSDSGLAPGHAEYLTKPLDYAALLAALRRIDPALRPARTRVLIVDDDPLVAQLLETMLPPSDYEVTTLTSPLDALERIRRGAPDALILDLLMPEMSGNELLQILRADPLTRDLPVIIVTAKHIGVDEQARLAETAQTVIRKTDLTCDRLIEALRRLHLPAPSEARVMEVIP